MNTYTLTLTENQARVISMACELLSRLGIGQWPHFIEHLPGDSDEHAWELENKLFPIMTDWFRHHPASPRAPRINGSNSSLGIGNPDVPAKAQTAFDLHQVIRHRLAWDRAIADGITDGTRREWSDMSAVYYDEPMSYGAEPLARTEKTE